MGLLIDSDANLFRSFFNEMAALRGQPVKYRYPLENKRYTTHTELRASYSDPIDTNIIFEEYPKQRTLKRHGWFSENSDDKPYIAYVDYHLKNLQQGCLITVGSGISEQGRIFRITSISNIMEFPDSFTVKLVPEYESNAIIQQKSYEDTNFNYLKEDEGED